LPGPRPGAARGPVGHAVPPARHRPAHRGARPAQPPAAGQHRLGPRRRPRLSRPRFGAACGLALLPGAVPMAGCEQGYLCDVCGQDVESIPDSDLYLRYVLGEVSPLELPSARERHIRCNPATAQYIVDPAFAPVRCEGFFAKESLDPAFVAE